jgi:hypothetical protein
MKQFKVIRAYKALTKLGQQDLPIKLAFDLFKIKQALQPQWDFQVDEVACPYDLVRNLVVHPEDAKGAGKALKPFGEP